MILNNFEEFPFRGFEVFPIRLGKNTKEHLETLFSGKLEVGCENGKFLQSCNQSYGDELNQLMTKLEAYMYSKEEAQMDLKNQLALVNQYAGFRGR